MGRRHTRRGYGSGSGGTRSRRPGGRRRGVQLRVPHHQRPRGGHEGRTKLAGPRSVAGQFQALVFMAAIKRAGLQLGVEAMLEKAYLRQAMRNKTLIPVVGAGFAQATTAQATTEALPSWSRMLDRGIDYVRVNNLAPPGVIQAIEKSRDKDPLPRAFDRLQNAMRATASTGKAPHYESNAYKG